MVEYYDNKDDIVDNVAYYDDRKRGEKNLDKSDKSDESDEKSEKSEKSEIEYYDNVEDMTSLSKIIHMGKKIKYLVVDLYGPWCVPCRKALPYYEELADKYNSYKNIKFIKMDIKYDEDFFSVNQVPAFAFLRKGKLVGDIIYGADMKAIEKRVKKMLKEDED